MIICGSSLVNIKSGELLKTNTRSLIPRPSFPPRIKYGVNSGGPPAHRASGPEGIQVASGPEGKHWIPPYQVRGRLSQARDDK
jgi:hypothetical protein